jgi:predicted short-subunit dehydrogenase-like oxidoreductase (DUF2520 family)
VTTKREKRRPAAPSSRRRIEKLSVSIIGAGRLGLALGTALRKAGVAIDVAVTRTPATARRAARLLRAPAVAVGSKSLGELPRQYHALLQQADLILIAAPDDVVSQISEQLADFLRPLGNSGNPRFRRRSAVMHTSGALTSGVLKSIKRLGFPVGSLHPLVSISRHQQNVQPFSAVYFSLEGDAGAVRLGKQLVRTVKGRSFVIQTRNKPLYHAAALMASPNLTALVDIAIEMMTRSGIRPSQARRMLLP